jgi:hypothetical protein
MSEPEEYRENSQAVQAHLRLLQSVIERMAGNSSSCKAWCIALVSAMLVVVGDKHQPEYVWIALIPTLLFLSLDAYYLALERGFRRSYNDFIDKVHRGRLAPSDLYSLEPSGSLFRQFLKSLKSFSVWPMYGTLVVMIYLAKRFVL